MSTPDPQQPSDPPADGARPGGAEESATEQPPGPSYDQPTAPTPGPQATQQYHPYHPLPGQRFDPRTGLPLAPPPAAPSGPQGYSAPYGSPPGYFPPSYQGGYPPPGYGAYPPPRPTNGMAIASLVLGILWIYWLGSILALIFGYLARQQIAQRGESGDGIAIAGIVLGWIGVGVLALLVLFLVLGAAMSVV